MRGFLRIVATMGVAMLFAGGVVPLALRAQQPTPEQRLRQQQDELDKLRKERADLEARMTELQRSARSLTDEVNNLEAQRQTCLLYTSDAADE